MAELRDRMTVRGWWGGVGVWPSDGGGGGQQGRLWGGGAGLDGNA